MKSVPAPAPDPVAPLGPPQSSAPVHRAPGAGPDIMIEVLYLRTGPDRQWYYRHTSRLLPPETDPGDIARRIAGLECCGPAATVLHSTSWRYQSTGQVILTYAVLPDPDPAADATPLRTTEIARGSSPAQPEPTVVSTENVAAHAVRHLALLLRTDPVIGRALESHSFLRDQLARYAPGAAGQLAQQTAAGV